MPLEDISTFAVLTAKLKYTAERQRLIAQNVANADTPNYAPSDLKAFTFETAMRGVATLTPSGGASSTSPSGLVLTQPGHMEGHAGAKPAWRPDVKPDSEARVDGNQVVLEDQMAKMTEARLDHEAAINFYQKSLSMLKLAAKAPGK